MSDPEPSDYFSGPVPRVIAHRGVGLDGLGNTAEAFTRAIDAGADLLETDVRASVDGVAVLVHDADIAMPDGRRQRVDRLRWEELARLPLPRDERVLSLENALRRFPDARFNLDVKARNAVRPVVDAVLSTGSLRRVLITSFSEARRSAAVCLLPGVATSASAVLFAVALLGAHARQGRLVRFVLRRIDALQVPERALGLSVVAPRILARLRDAGVEIHIWTVNDPRRMGELLARGVDGLVTDRTDLARSAVDTLRQSSDGSARNTPPT